jgi:hypothetical protein
MAKKKARDAILFYALAGLTIIGLSMFWLTTSDLA